MKTLTPLVLREKYFASIEAEIQRIFNILIYRPLNEILGGKTIEITNSLRDLADAVANGRIAYEGGRFTGKFSSTLSKELRRIGARYNPLSRSWSLPLEQLPADLRIAQAAADARITAIRKEMIRVMDNIKPDSVSKLSDAQAQYGRTVEAIQADFEKATSAIAIPVTLTPAQRDIIAREWGQNLDLYIQGWVDQNIVKLREQVMKNAFAGGRAESLQKMLQDNYGTSKSKAKFLARQETALLMSKYQETKYADIGITKYRWSTSHDERVRPDHARLNGQVFTFDQPPVTDRKTGARNNPGEDFNCRCIAVPVVE